MKLFGTFRLLIASFCMAVSVAAGAAEFRSEELNFSIATDENWALADADVLKLINQSASQGPIAHARAKGENATTKAVDSSVLLLCSKLPLGSQQDNPNLILAKEKAWSEEFEKSGAGYLKLMQERVKLLRAPTKFIGEPKLVKIGDVEFHQMDAVNTKVANAETKQQYLCTFRKGYYVYFVLSLNDEKDADYKNMMGIVRSFRVPKQ